MAALSTGVMLVTFDEDSYELSAPIQGIIQAFNNGCLPIVHTIPSGRIMVPYFASRSSETVSTLEFTSLYFNVKYKLTLHSAGSFSFSDGSDDE